MCLTREQILNVNDLKLTRVNVPEWGGDVFLRTLTGTERWRMIDNDLTKGREFYDFLLLSCLCDQDGQRFFGDDDGPLLGNKCPDVLDRLLKECLQINGLGGASTDEVEKKTTSES